MFGNKEAKVKTSINGIDSVISNGTTVNGPMKFVGSIKIAGEALGDVTGSKDEKSKGETSVIVELTGKIQGNVECDNVIIAGNVFGNISAKSVYITSTGLVHGQVRYQVLQVEPGAKVSGDVSYNQQNDKAQPILKEAA